LVYTDTKPSDVRACSARHKEAHAEEQTQQTALTQRWKGRGDLSAGISNFADEKEQNVAAQEDVQLLLTQCEYPVSVSRPDARLNRRRIAGLK
jgi:hypothetical protein